MLLPNIFGENLFDDWMNFSFPDIDKALYGKQAQHVMKTDVKETADGYEFDIDLPGYKKDEVNVQFNNLSARILRKKRFMRSLKMAF